MYNTYSDWLDGMMMKYESEKFDPSLDGFFYISFLV